MINFKSATFLQSAPQCSFLPSDSVAEIAFAGRSNAGKSTLLNCLCAKASLAKTSSVPGKTREINLFSVDTTLKTAVRLVDLPGYGYAKVGKQMKALWQKELTNYLEKRENLKVLVLIMDARHPLTELDKALITIISRRSLKQIFVFNKIDKLKQSEKYLVNKIIKETIYHWPNCTAITHSSIHHTGTLQLASLLCQTLNEVIIAQKLLD